MDVYFGYKVGLQDSKHSPVVSFFWILIFTKRLLWMEIFDWLCLINFQQKQSPQILHLRAFYPFKKWSWGDSNPCPNKAAISFLHAYFIIIFRCGKGNEQTNPALSRMILSRVHGIALQHPGFDFESAAERGTRKTCSRGPNGYLITD